MIQNDIEQNIEEINCNKTKISQEQYNKLIQRKQYLIFNYFLLNFNSNIHFQFQLKHEGNYSQFLLEQLQNYDDEIIIVINYYIDNIQLQDLQIIDFLKLTSIFSEINGQIQLQKDKIQQITIYFLQQFNLYQLITNNQQNEQQLIQDLIKKAIDDIKVYADSNIQLTESLLDFIATLSKIQDDYLSQQVLSDFKNFNTQIPLYKLITYLFAYILHLNISHMPKTHGRLSYWFNTKKDKVLTTILIILAKICKNQQIQIFYKKCKLLDVSYIFYLQDGETPFTREVSELFMKATIDGCLECQNYLKQICDQWSEQQLGKQFIGKQ